ncbi:MAG TPA: hypothetical protein VGN82_07405 [Bosea sp. (in: a-proteobacteria)]|uniref:hypothetical protein n=1 Tax=Bosea sp. (in: a-proteobacteria) TaxID=1871050 RepID=UPI002E13164F|nr:hypothetical protein [Bosea sp. (in: a-proteobacteria)]
MSLLSHLWHRLVEWFAKAVLAGAPEPDHRPALLDEEDDEARRTSIHDVTLEQLGVAHWSSHAHF